MGFFEAIVLGIVQGATEFLPVSSSGHLVLVPAAFGWPSPSLAFDATVHLGTTIAVLGAFWRELVDIAASWWDGLRTRRPLATPNSRLAWWLILGTVPGALAGLFLGKTFESFFSSPHEVGIFLLITAALLILGETVGWRRRDLAQETWLDSLLIGIGQAAAIAPGLSRSGTTMAVGMFRGLTREAAARFSFLLSAPIIAGAALVQLAKLGRNSGLGIEAPLLFVGFISSAVLGYAAIRLLLAYLRKRPFYPFAAYCLVIGLLAWTLL